MCGICGFVNHEGKHFISRNALAGMMQAMAHRGPDDDGIYLGMQAREGSYLIGLGHRRLSIIDLSVQGHQPMSNEDGTIWIAFNGEIYNFKELRDDLIRKGHSFKSHTDTEVILHLYEEKAENCVYDLRGMFAFAIWDLKLHKLVLFRDRVGIKPLYYMPLSGGLVFSSEIKPILKYLKEKPGVNLLAINEYMNFGYAVGLQTIFKGIYKLLPGHMLISTKEGLSIKQYWDLGYSNGKVNRQSYYINELKNLLNESVKLHLQSDVPVGVFLSGGIDSSTIVGLASALHSGKIKTFSAVFNNETGYSESEYSRLIARQFNTEHYEVAVSPSEFKDFIPNFIWYQEEPTTDPSGIPLYYVSKLASRHVKVILSGEGSDEIFAGYPAYKHIKMMEHYRLMPAWIRKRIIWPFAKRMLKNEKINHFLALSSLPVEERYFGFRFYDLDSATRTKILSEKFKYDMESADPRRHFSSCYGKVRHKDVLSKLLYVDTKIWLPEDILIKSDRMSMATSIELRVPFLDNKMIDFAAKIPSSFKLKGYTGKYILKKAVAQLLPSKIINRSKVGFPVPIASLLRKELRNYSQEILFDHRAVKRGYFDINLIKNIVKDHLEYKADNHKVIWMLLILELWHNKFID